MAHDGTSPLRGPVGFTNGNFVSLIYQHRSHQLGPNHVTLTAYSGNYHIIWIFFHLGALLDYCLGGTYVRTDPAARAYSLIY